jgi:hypothetical protein
MMLELTNNDLSISEIEPGRPKAVRRHPVTMGEVSVGRSDWMTVEFERSEVGQFFKFVGTYARFSPHGDYIMWVEKRVDNRFVGRNTERGPRIGEIGSIDRKTCA